MDTCSGTGATRRGTPRLIGLAVLGVVWLGVSGCVSQGVADQVNQRINYGMTTSEEKVAYATALHRARREEARVTARATVSETAASGSPAASPAGSAAASPEPCTTGRLLHITLTGQFPHHLFTDEARTTRVSGQVLTVDATTGEVCESHYVSGLVPVDAQSVLLFSL